MHHILLDISQLLLLPTRSTSTMSAVSPEPTHSWKTTSMSKFSINLVELQKASVFTLHSASYLNSPPTPVWHTSPNWEGKVEGKYFLLYYSIICTDLFSPWASSWNHLRSREMPSLWAKHDLAASNCPEPRDLITVDHRAQCWPEGNDFLFTWVYT